MDNVTRDTVHCIANDVRYWVEGLADTECGYDESPLSGYCAIASVELFRRLKTVGLKPEIHCWSASDSGIAHVFLVLDDYVVDVTASQFRECAKTTVVIKHVREAERFYFWNSSYSTDCDVAFIKKQRKDRWPASQIAYAK